MNKKSLLGLLLFACVVITGLFAGANLLTRAGSRSDLGTGAYSDEEITEANTGDEAGAQTTDTIPENTASDASLPPATEGLEGTPSAAPLQTDTGLAAEEPDDTVADETQTSDVPADMAAGLTDTAPVIPQETSETSDHIETPEAVQSTATTSFNTAEAPKLILNCKEIDYKAYIPEMVHDNELDTALDIDNPGISVDASAAILLDSSTGKVLFYKNAVQAMFPASTAKLLSSLVILRYCKENEEVTIGDEITMIAPDSTTAGISQGQVLTIRDLMTGMLLPSGNDAAYAAAAYVGRKSLDNSKATKEEAIAEFVRLMNEEAANLGAKNSCFKTPDGYDAVGQYTTAYDMGLIGVTASKNDVITDISQKSSSRNIFVSGEDVTWNNTNKLITRYSGQFYSKAIGLKTGTSTMAGRCLIAAAENNGRKVVCVILDSTIEGRWEDAIALLKYGLN